MVIGKKKHSDKPRVNQGASADIAEPNKIGSSTPNGQQFGRRMSAKIALPRRMEPLQIESDRNSGLKHYPLRNWPLSGA